MGNDQTQQIKQEKEKPQNKKITQKQKQPEKIQRALNTSKTQEQIQQFFVLENINKIALLNSTSQVIIWIDPNFYNGENQKYFAELSEHFQMDGYTSLQGAKSSFQDIPASQKVKIICSAALNDKDYQFLQQQPKISQLYLFCQNQQKAKLLMYNYKKIHSASYFFDDLVKKLKQQKASKGKVVVKGNTILGMVKEDIKQLNKYRLNYACLCKYGENGNSKNDFIMLANKIYPQDEKAIKQFQQQYKTHLDENSQKQQILNWAFRKSFYWDLISNLPRATTDPKQLTYLRLPFCQLYRTIYNQYKKDTKKLSKLFIVTVLNKKEQQMFSTLHDNFFIFTSFVRGYTTIKDAQRAMKQVQNSFLITILINKKKKDPALDFGYLVKENKQQNQPNVIFNLYNFFRVQQYEPQGNSILASYAPLSQASFKRTDTSKGRQRLTPFESDMLRNFDYVEDLRKKIHGHANLLQLSGYFKDSLEVYERKNLVLTKSHASSQIMDAYYIELAQAYKFNEDYDKAQAELAKVKSQKMKLTVKVSLLEVYYKKKEMKRFNLLLQQLQPNLKQHKEIDQQSSFKIQHFLAISAMETENFKKALKILRLLIAKLTKYYDYKYEGIPLVHDLFRNVAVCESKLSNYQQAINMLNTAKSWQGACEGQSPETALTETMLHQVYSSQGQVQKAKQCKQQIKQIKKTLIASDFEYLNRSKVVIDLNESRIDINFDI